MCTPSVCTTEKSLASCLSVGPVPRGVQESRNPQSMRVDDVSCCRSTDAPAPSDCAVRVPPQVCARRRGALPSVCPAARLQTSSVWSKTTGRPRSPVCNSCRCELHPKGKPRAALHSGQVVQQAACTWRAHVGCEPRVLVMPKRAGSGRGLGCARSLSPGNETSP